MEKNRLEDEMRTLLGALRGLGSGRYACLLEAKGILLEDPEPEEPAEKALHTFLHAYRAQVLAIPEALDAEGPTDDVFDGWNEDDFFLAFINRKVALVVACPDGELLKQQSEKLIRALADRLFRWNGAYRMDSRGRGFFFGRAKLDLVVAGRSER